jgi:predicted nucleic acid-binding protein
MGVQSMTTSARFVVTPSRSSPTPRPLIFVDSNVYLDLITKSADPHPDTRRERWRSAKELFDAINDDRARLASSALIEAEVLCNGESRRDSERIRGLLRTWFNAPSTVWTDVDRFVARDASKLAERYAHLRDNPSVKGLKGADATHLAAAIRLNCDYLMTYDRGFPIGHTVDGVEVIRPRTVWPLTLLDEMTEESVIG